MPLEVTYGTGSGVCMVSAGDTEVIYVDYTDILDGSEVLASTPTVVQVTPSTSVSELTLGSKNVMTTAVTICGRSVAAYKSLRCSATAFVANTTYTLRFTTVTNATPARTFVRDVKLRAI